VTGRGLRGDQIGRVGGRQESPREKVGRIWRTCRDQSARDHARPTSRTPSGPPPDRCASRSASGATTAVGKAGRRGDRDALDGREGDSCRGATVAGRAIRVAGGGHHRGWSTALVAPPTSAGARSANAFRCFLRGRGHRLGSCREGVLVRRGHSARRGFPKANSSVPVGGSAIPPVPGCSAVANAPRRGRRNPPVRRSRRLVDAAHECRDRADAAHRRPPTALPTMATGWYPWSCFSVMMTP
jgi:hypothetical protein